MEVLRQDGAALGGGDVAGVAEQSLHIGAGRRRCQDPEGGG